MYDQCGTMDLSQARKEIVVAEAVPYSLLRPRDYAEGRQVFGVLGICEISGDAQLEQPMAIRVRISLAKARRLELGSHLLNGLTLLPFSKLVLELNAVSFGERSRIDENETVRW